MSRELKFRLWDSKVGKYAETVGSDDYPRDPLYDHDGRWKTVNSTVTNRMVL